MKTALQALFGLLVWLALAGATWLAIDRRAAEGTLGAQVAPRIWQYWTTPERTAILELPRETEVAVGDPVFIAGLPGEPRQVGEVQRLLDDRGVVPLRQAIAPRVEVRLFPAAPSLDEGTTVAYHTTEDSLNWVIETLLPPHRKAEITAELAAAWERHQDEILSALQPLVEASVEEAAQIAEEELPKSLARHREEWQALGDRYQREIIADKLTPLAKEQIWPILQRRAEPVLNEVGQEVWGRVSLWRFGWRIAYDKTLLPNQRLTEKEWDRFVEQEMRPVLESHMDQFVEVVKDTVRDAAENEQVRATLRDSIDQVARDPDFRRLVRTTANETVLENPRMRAALKRHWTGPEAQAVLRLAAERFEPTLRNVADRVLGTRADGVSPEFAAVLRNQILRKDRRWFEITIDSHRRLPGASRNSAAAGRSPATAPPVLTVRPAAAADRNPFVQPRASAPHGTAR